MEKIFTIVVVYQYQAPRQLKNGESLNTVNPLLPKSDQQLTSPNNTNG